MDGSRAMGIFAKETVSVGLTNGRKAKIQEVLVGCSDSFRGQSFEKADGVLGLAYGKYSFVSKAAEKFGGKFSYCLVDHLSHKNVSNYIIFGGKKTETTLAGKMRYTKLALINPFYAVNVKEISIGDVMLKIPGEVWDGNRGGGAIVDSGTSLSFLSKPAYEPVMAELKKSVARYRRTKINGVPMEYCFNSTGFVEASIPKMVFHFTDGAKFEPHVKSYMVDVAKGVKCIGILSVNWPGISNIGNIMQQNHFWEFDLTEGKLGFAPSTCT